MNGITELALLLKERENHAEFSPLIGKIIELPNINILVGDNIQIKQERLTMCIQPIHTAEYTDIGRSVVLLPYNDFEKFILLGWCCDVSAN